MARTIPTRTCTGCGTKREKGSLIRLAVGQGGEVVVDRAQVMMGRGAYLCGPGCLRSALKKRAFGRAFRGQAAPFDETQLLEALGGAGLQGHEIGLHAAPRRK